MLGNDAMDSFKSSGTECQSDSGKKETVKHKIMYTYMETKAMATSH